MACVRPADTRQLTADRLKGLHHDGGYVLGTSTTPHVSPTAVRLYGQIVQGQQPGTAREPELQELCAAGYVTVDARSGECVPLDPAAVAGRLLHDQLAALARQVGEIGQAQETARVLAVDYEQAQWRSAGGSELLAEPGLVNARLDDAVASARSEILAAQPSGPRTREQLERSVRRDTAALGRGVTLRTLYRDAVRDAVVTADQARVMTARGAAYRTLVAPFQRAIIIDRKTAFISDYVLEGAPAYAAWQVKDAAIVAWLAEYFEEVWRRAHPWHGESQTAGVPVEESGVRTTFPQREILRDLVSGVMQKTTAARLGVGVRSLQREVDQVKEIAGVTSLPELAYWWALSPDRLVDDTHHTAGEEGGPGGLAAAA